MKDKLVYDSTLWIELDSSEIYPSDPGMGTPAMVVKKEGHTKYYASFNCACGEGEVDGVTLTQDECDWLNDQENEVNDFIDENSPVAA